MAPGRPASRNDTQAQAPQLQGQESVNFPEAPMPIRSRSQCSHAIISTICLAAMLSLGSGTSALAGAGTLACSEGDASIQCQVTWGPGAGGIARVIEVDAPRDEGQRRASAERFQRWTERCRPVVRPDRYGVGRYFYAASGCEFGRTRD